jgi:signal recognition particle GTPase
MPAADDQNKVPELSLMVQNSGGYLNRPTQIPPLPPEKKFESVASGGEDVEAVDPEEDSVEFRKYRTIREKANAERAQIDSERVKHELEELKGRLISKDFAVQAVFTAFRAIRDAVLNVPARMKEEIAAEADSDACEQLLEMELTRALTSVDLTKIFSAEDLES